MDWNSPGQDTGVGSLSLLQGNLPNPGIEPRSPVLQVDSFTAEPQGKPKKTGVGSLSLLQRIFLTQGSNQVSCIAGKFFSRCKVKVPQSCLTFSDPTDCTVHGILQARILEWVAFPFSRVGPRSPALQADSLPAEPQGKPKKTELGSPSLLQGIFQTQESNHGLLNCRWIIYQLSFEGSNWSL